MKYQMTYRIAAALLCLAGPVLYNAFQMSPYVYLISLVGVIALLFIDRGSNKNSGKKR
ncbi:hypothetical protein IEO70_16115 [Bacillus sp. AGMB 02131]|uniref:Uncharacterized protein n=1 Tax=Peribacillus faecalis TaxID=2772559 RepID=A0A927HCT7_9BACI|nr:hypothetical protein [Peribacillus faecalis]MBD3109866.1 hypothetical protein [Peribacillus faecalis]